MFVPLNETSYSLCCLTRRVYEIEARLTSMPVKRKRDKREDMSALRPIPTSPSRLFELVLSAIDNARFFLP